MIDTTDLSANQLRSRLLALFSEGPATQVSATLLSFGFKYGVPADADFVFDTRMLPNPFYIEELRDLTGMDEAVQNYVMDSPGACELADLLFSIIEFGARNYTAVHKYHTVIAIGCTGGKHRSVTLANLLTNRLSGSGIRSSVHHRDIERI